MNPQQVLDTCNEAKAVFQKFHELIKDYTMIGSATYISHPSDVDYAVLVNDNFGDCTAVSRIIESNGWGKCGEYDTDSGTSEVMWCAIRKDSLNLMLTHDQGFYDRYVMAMKVAKALRLQDKRDRIIVCQVIRDGRSPEEARAANYPFKSKVVNGIDDGSY